ncbi:hypothetical protein P9314_05155 [Paenibacillus validus]|uniref:hypothetical protein n=1 Tax=Paenibacillus validus TaxID=44253 RepID=UPI000FD7A255|nr:hypothetical protein [Paenibacillus validus]MED4600097.1 hypothetical protein [Paenibacillus validus]MED4605545.1 hypothetical protein [Paenibacillus validus]
MSAEQQRMNPHNWAYRQYWKGNAVHPIAFSVMTQKFHQEDVMQLLEEICRVVKQIAVSSGLLTAHQRRKYADNKVRRNKWVYYLFPLEAVPYDVYVRLQPEENKRVYARNAGGMDD